MQIMYLKLMFLGSYLDDFAINKNSKFCETHEESGVYSS